MPDQESERPRQAESYPQSPTVLVSTAMDLFGLRSAGAKRRFTRYTVGGLFAIVTVLSIMPTLWPGMDGQQREACKSLVWYCMSGMFVLLTLQAIRNNEDR